jgi:hypothetical protein
MKLVICLLFLLYAGIEQLLAQNDTLVNYAAPGDAVSATDYSLQINRKKVFIYYSRTAAFAYCSFKGKLTLTVNSAAYIHSFAIRPSAKKVAAVAKGHELTFSITEPMQLSIEINENIKRPLFIFANSLEEEVPAEDAKNVIRFRAGKIYDTGRINVQSGQVLYIEGGAIVKGFINAENIHDVKIMGRGILDNSDYTKAEARPVAITNSSNVLLEGFIIMESKHWSCGAYSSNHIRYHDIKIVSDNDWDDGIDIVASNNIEVSHCFLRTKDDCIAIKSGVDYFGKADHANVFNVFVHDCTVWNGMWGNALEIGFETSTDTIQNIRFENCDIIHTEGPEGTFTIHNGDHALVKNISYENIRVEDAQGYLIDFKILLSQYSTDKTRGNISNVYFKSIYVSAEKTPPSLLLGFDSTHTISHVIFDHLYIGSNHILNAAGGMLTTTFADSVLFK